jgi:polysaccharide biosynthesis protein PelE
MRSEPIPEPPAGFPEPGLDALIAALALAGEVAVVLVYRPAGPAFWLALLAHLAVWLLLTLAALVRHASQGDTRIPWLLALSTPVAGPVAPAGALLILAVVEHSRRRAPSAAQIHESLFPEDETREQRELMELVDAVRAAGQEASAVAPLVDILAFGNEDQKLAVISLVTASYHPSFAPVLDRALEDPSESVRKLAATARARLESQFSSRSIEISRALRERGEDPALLREAARHYDEASFSGVLDAHRRQESRSRSLELYRQYLEHSPEDREAHHAVGRLLLRQQNYPEAARWLGRPSDGGPSGPDEAVWLAEALFRSGRMAELRSLMARWAPAIAAAEHLPLQVREAVRLWTGGATELSPREAEQPA